MNKEQESQIGINIQRSLSTTFWQEYGGLIPWTILQWWISFEQRRGFHRSVTASNIFTGNLSVTCSAEVCGSSCGMQKEKFNKNTICKASMPRSRSAGEQLKGSNYWSKNKNKTWKLNHIIWSISWIWIHRSLGVIIEETNKNYRMRFQTTLS